MAGGTLVCVGIEKALVSLPRGISSSVVWEGPRYAFVSTRGVQGHLRALPGEFAPGG